MAKQKKKGKKKEKKTIIRRKSPILRKKKKRWVPILAPKSFGGKEIGESFIADPNDLKGRRVVVSLNSLGRGRNSNFKIIFSVKEITDGGGVCEAVGYYILNSFAKRVVRKGKSKIRESFKLKTKDGSAVVLKVVLVTKTKISRGISRTIRKEMRGFIGEKVKNKPFELVLNSIVEYNFQKEIKDRMKKLYPVSSLEILMFKKA
jgi:ribosomal protein S3AE